MIDEIKEKIDIVEFIRNYVELKKVGSYYRGLCPFHSEKNPSFYVSPQKQIFKCFGCNRGGDVVTFYMMIENLEFKEAINRLREMLGLDIREAITEESKNVKKLLEINKIALNFYKKNLTKNKEVLDYIKKRGVSDKYIDYFDLGYANIGNELRDYLFKLGYKLEDLKEVGLLNDKKEDKFQNRIIFPLIDYKKRIIGFAGRLFPEREYGPKYLNSPDTKLFKKSSFIYGLVYAKDEILKNKEVIITEGQFDLILAFQNGIRNIVAISGSSFTEDQLRLLKRFCNKIVFALDNDQAGFNALLRAALLALKNDFEIENLDFGNYKDLGEFFENNEDKNKIKRTSFIDFVLNYFSKNLDLEDIENKRVVLNKILPLIKYYDPASKMNYIDKISNLLNIKNNFILEELEKIKEEKTNIQKEIIKTEVDRFKLLLERYSAIGLALNRKNDLSLLKNFLDEEDFVYIENIINDVDNEEVEFIKLRSLYEESLNQNLEDELKFLEKEIIKELFRKKIKFLKNLLNFSEKSDIENILKKVKIYTEKLKAIEKND